MCAEETFLQFLFKFHEPLKLYLTFNSRSTMVPACTACVHSACVRASKQSGAQIEGLCGVEPEAPAIFRKG